MNMKSFVGVLIKSCSENEETRAYGLEMKEVLLRAKNTIDDFAKKNNAWPRISTNISARRGKTGGKSVSLVEVKIMNEAGVEMNHGAVDEAMVDDFCRQLAKIFVINDEDGVREPGVKVEILKEIREISSL